MAKKDNLKQSRDNWKIMGIILIVVLVIETFMLFSAIGSSNENAEKYNDCVEKYNELVEQAKEVEKLYNECANAYSKQIEESNKLDLLDLLPFFLG